MSKPRHRSVWAKAEIAKVLKQARRCLKHSGLDILLHPCAAKKGRIVVITPRSIGVAVERNRIRRRLKSLFYKQFLDLGFDCIVIAKKPGVKLTSEQLGELLMKAYNNCQNSPK